GPRDAGGARARPKHAARRGARARREPLADGARRRAADELGRDSHRNRAGGRARGGRDGTAPVYDIDSRERRHVGPAPACALDPLRHLCAVRVGGSRRSRPCLGARVRADLLRPRDELDCAPAAGPIPKEAGELTMEADTMNGVAPIEIAQPREAPRSASDREIVFETRGLTVSYGKAAAVSDVDLSI